MVLECGLVVMRAISFTFSFLGKGRSLLPRENVLKKGSLALGFG
jgi:hypothetical protein